jgi:hypothetical protein
MRIVRRYSGRLATVLTVVILALPQLAAQPSNNGFLIDASMPFVQIIFDHAGNRRPLSEFEPPFGLWLRLKNNSRIPIRVVTFQPGTSDPGVGVADEVMAIKSSEMVMRSPDEAGQSSTARITAGKGYSRDVGSPATIAPRESVLFSVPLNHVGPTWFLRIQFEFDLPPVKFGRQPYAYVDFTWSDVPPTVRQLWTPPPQVR